MTLGQSDYAGTAEGQAIIELVETGISLPDAVRFVGQSYVKVIGLMQHNSAFSGRVDRARGYYSDGGKAS